MTEIAETRLSRVRVANFVTTIVAVVVVAFMAWRMMTPTAPTYGDVMAEASRH